MGAAMTLELQVVNIAGEVVCTANLQTTSTMPELRAIVEAKAGLPADAQRLLHGTRELIGSGSLGDLLQGCTQEVPLTLMRRTADQAEWLEKLRGGYRRWWELGGAPEEIRGDCGCILAALEQDGKAIQYASAELQADRDFMLAALGQSPDALRYASAELQADRDFMKVAVVQTGWSLSYASAELQADRAFVLAVVGQEGRDLRYASVELQADRSVVLEAVGQNGNALEYASAKLQADCGVVLVAVGQNGDSLEFASEELKADCSVVLAAVGQNSDALDYAPAWLQLSIRAHQAEQKCTETQHRRAEAQAVAAVPAADGGEGGGAV